MVADGDGQRCWRNDASITPPRLPPSWQWHCLQGYCTCKLLATAKPQPQLNPIGGPIRRQLPVDSVRFSRLGRGALSQLPTDADGNSAMQREPVWELWGYATPVAA